jgi:hypothetical protein
VSPPATVGRAATGTGPGGIFAAHPALYALALGGAAWAAAAMAARAARARGARRIGWAALAVLEAAIVVGIMREKRRAVWPNPAPLGVDCPAGQDERATGSDREGDDA